MKVLTRYSQSKNITNLDNTTQEQYLESLSKTPSEQLQSPDDYYNPFSYEEWYRRNIGVIAGSEKAQYDEYLKNWKNTRYTSTVVTNNLRDSYVSFLKNLTLILNKEDKTNWLVDINWDDQFEVEQAIPFFATKLKEIAVYLANKREALKRTKLKYNMAGANQALEKLFYEYLLKAFTRRDYVMNVPEQTVFSSFPDLSSVGNFQIIIDELYDDTSYMDKDPSLSAGNYFDTTNPDITAYYESLNISPSTYEWFFSTGFSQVCADNPMMFMLNEIVASALPLSAYLSPDDQTLNEYFKFKLTEKYLGETQYWVSGGYYKAWEQNVTFNLAKGNNWFYWPSGEFINETANLTIDTIPVLSSSLIESGATGSKNYLSADKIFIRYGDTVSGAWLKYVEQIGLTTAMSAKLVEGNNIFSFPFPGYGISGEDISWTGKQLSNLDNEFDYLDTTLQEGIKQSYWTTSTLNSSICATPLSDTQLIDQGAYAAKIYNQSDRISVRTNTNIDRIHDTTPDTLYTGGMEHAWLYKMDTTDIPISRQQNYIHWPLERYERNTTTVSNILTSQCSPQNLATIPISSFVGSRAGYGFFDSDIIYKLDSQNGDPIECAFLSGCSLDNFGGTSFTCGATGIIQSSLSLKCTPNNYQTFIWTDDDTDISNINIKHVPHQSDCPYLFLEHHSLFKENPSDQKTGIDYRQWQQCECRAISYSPLGHPGATYDEYQNMADIIFLDTLHPLPFTKNAWIGLDGETYQNSEDFAWFQLSGSRVEPDVGWSQGQWVAGGNPSSTRKFTLKKGQQYKYYRSSLGHNQTYLVDGTVPYMIIKHQYQNAPEPTWVKTIVDTNGNWQIASNGIATDMVLKPNDYILYDHIDSNWYCITGIGSYGSVYSYNPSATLLNGSIWQNYDFVTTGTQINFTWPNTLHEGIAGAPDVLAFQLSAIIWGITGPNNQTSAYLRTPNEIMSIIPNTIGTWVVNVTGMKVRNGGNNYYYGDTPVKYNNIGNFTVSPFLLTISPSGSDTINTIYADTINTTINAPLYGWDYTTHSYNGTSHGARPFWALADDQDSKTTKHKGIDIWGGGIRVVDDYVLVTQPERSNITLDTDIYFEYRAINNFNWIEPLTINVVSSSVSWKDLIIDGTKVATLSDYLYNINQELVIDATNNSTNLFLAPKINGELVTVNYFANNAFQWTQMLTNSSLGIPPTGGVFVPLATGVLMEATYPYANLSNRHFPTIATVPHVEELYSIEDSGGYFVPRMLGMTTALAKNVTNTLNGVKIPNNGEGNNSFIYINNPVTYTRDRGMSQNDQNIIIENENINSLWMKSPVTTWKKAGMIVDASTYQQFIPYKTKYEIAGINNVGVHQQSDAYDPWTGDLDDTWENNIDYPSNFTKQFSITDWYSKFIPANKEVYQWKTDIFNNQYTLLKSNLNTFSNYEKKHLIEGEIWVRNSRNIVSPISAMITDIYVTPSAIGLLNNRILDMDIFYDTLMYYVSDGLFFYKIDMNYETGAITSDINTYHLIPLSANNKFGGTWLTDDKSVTICTLLSANDQIRPILYDLNLNTNDLNNIYNLTSLDTGMSAYNLTAYEHPVFTYDKLQNKYNISYIAYGVDKVGMYLTTLNLVNSGGSFIINNAKTIVPQC